jgi:cupin 2 domain-containing protein
MMKIENIFNSLKIPSASVVTEEVFEKLLSTPYFTLERIVSTGQSTPPGQWYDQTQDEWVILLSGSAGFSFETEKTEKIVQVLRPGDYIHIPAHQRHRVEWTDSLQPTLWLALHYRNKEY